MDEGFGADVLWHEIGVLPQAVAGAFDLHDDGVVQKPVQQGCGDHGIAKGVMMPPCLMGCSAVWMPSALQSARR